MRVPTVVVKTSPKYCHTGPSQNRSSACRRFCSIKFFTIAEGNGIVRRERDVLRSQNYHPALCSKPRQRIAPKALRFRRHGVPLIYGPDHLNHQNRLVGADLVLFCKTVVALTSLSGWSPHLLDMVSGSDEIEIQCLGRGDPRRAIMN